MKSDYIYISQLIHIEALTRCEEFGGYMRRSLSAVWMEVGALQVENMKKYPRKKPVICRERVNKKHGNN